MGNNYYSKTELSSEEKRALLAHLLQEKTKKSKLALQDTCVHQLFEHQVERTPDAVAVIFDDVETRHVASLTYRELNQQANQLAHHLQALGVKPEVLVGICMERSLEMVVGLLGILKAGGAYLPLDPAYPQERLGLMLADAKPLVLLSQQRLLERLGERKAQVICLDSDWEMIAQQSEENPISGTTIENLAYVIYSSRQGVLVEHRGVAHRLDWLQNTFALSESDTVLHQAPLAQDMLVSEIFWPLVTGGRLAIASFEAQDNQAYLQHLIATQKVSIAHFVPSALSAFVASLNPHTATQLNSLRLVLCSGEPLRRTVVEKLYQHLTSELHYLYSLPETAGEVTSFACQSIGMRDILPIGRSTYKSVYVLDQRLQPVPVGVKGEIYVGGASLARGYLQTYEETELRFVENPFSETPGAYLFKTGELGRRLNDGTLELLGSINRQTWLEGFRVELQEIEAALLTAPLVEDCRVLVRETETTAPQLVAYVVLSKRFSLMQLQSHLQAMLPPHMLPSAYVPLFTLPLTATGQVDDEALARLEVIDSELVQRWEEKLREAQLSPRESLPEIEQVAVVVQDKTTQEPLLHLYDLLPISAPESVTTVDTIPHRPEAIKEKSGSNNPAISYGEPLQQEADTPTTLAKALQRAAQQIPAKGLIYIQSDGSENSQSYRDLLEEAERILAGLRKLGLKPQDKVIFQLERNQDFIAAFWGCVLGGFVPVPISVAPTYDQLNSTISKLQNAWQMLNRPLVLTSAKLASGVRFLSEFLNLENFQVETVDDLRTCTPDQNWYVSQPDDLAILLLTSGSTGIPKAVMQSHRSLLSRSAATAQMNNFTNNDISLNWFPLDHVGGLVMFHLRDVYVGCQQIQAPIELVLQQPTRWLDWISHYRATITWAPNFAYGLINAQTQQLSQGNWDLSSMRFLLNGGEAIVAKHARKFLELLAPKGLPATAMHPAWGMSETCSGVTYSHKFPVDSTTDDDSFVSVGTPIPGCAIRIVDAQDQVVEEETIGRVQVKGVSVTSGYYQNPEVNREVFTDDGWFSTGDLGFLRQGCLTITGREKDVIIINGLNYYSHELEAVVEEVEGVEVSYTAAVGVRSPSSNTDKLVIFFSSAVSNEADLIKLIQEIRSQVVENIGINPNYLVPLDKQTIPKTAIGKIQRSQLKKRFETGEFNDILKHLDLITENANTIPDWFYQKIWHQKQALPLAPILQTGVTLVFLDQLELGTFLCGKLNQLNQPCVSVEAGSEFAQISRTCYRLNPNKPEHYQHLLESLAADNLCIAQILHLWTYDDYAGEVSSLEALEQAQKQGIYSLLFLLQALTKVQGSQASVQLQVISSHAQITSPTDKIAYEKSTLIGLLKTIPLEFPWLRCRHIDLEVEPVDVNADYILQELRIPCGDSEIAYRNGRRLISSVAKVNMFQQQTQDIPLKQGGIYLVTGGLGGIGTYLCQFLIKEYRAKLIIVGRTELPSKTEWSNHLDQETRVGKRIKSYQAIEATGNEFIYEAVDICDLASLQKVVARASSKWNQPLSGIIHLAGEGNLEYHWKAIDQHWVAVETPQSFDSILRPKVHGTWTLYQLIKHNPQAVFISFSSVNGVLGGATFSAYSAANSFLDCCSLYQRYHSQPQTYCFNWSMWDDLGMSQGNPVYARDAARDMGYHIISKEQGLTSLLAGLYRNQAQLIVGLDGSNRNIRRSIKTEFDSIQKLTAYFTVSSNGSPIGNLPELIVRDRFGTKSTCDFVQLEEMPLTDTGAIDREHLITLGNQNRRRASKQVAPRTEVEHQLANIWQEVLNIPVLGIYDNFFELGGHSLLATQLISRVREAFCVELPLRRLFDTPTVAQLAEVIEEMFIEKLEELPEDEAQHLASQLFEHR